MSPTAPDECVIRGVEAAANKRIQTAEQGLRGQAAQRYWILCAILRQPRDTESHCFSREDSNLLRS
jgi:hypothetical protein